MKIAVIKTGGKQYKVSQGQIIKIEKINDIVGNNIKFNTLMIADDDRLDLGRPSLGEKVEGKILEQGRSKKISVIKYKSKTRYRRNVGHRQPFTKVEITKIGE
jgi:large subunit ribosomal protein L21